MSMQKANDGKPSLTKFGTVCILCLCVIPAADAGNRYPTAFSFPNPRSALSSGKFDAVSKDRRRAFQYLAPFVTAVASAALSPFIIPHPPFVADAANLPKSTGADSSKTGTIETLVPILRLRESLQSAESIPSSVSSSSTLTIELIGKLNHSFHSIPTDETTFKRIFDEYSDPISYKQRFLDQNAFLVYYTKGYDGPNRPSIESDIVPETKQTLQYGMRNDAWAAWDDVMAELDFAAESEVKGGRDMSTVRDVLTPLNEMMVALDGYLSTVPAQDVEEGRRRLNG